MSGLFYSLGRLAGPMARKGRWIFQSLTGGTDDAIDAEYEVGRDLAGEFCRQQACVMVEDELVGEIGGRLVERVMNKRRRWRFAVIESPQPNAFALPGGFIFITNSLLELCRRDGDETAFIVGHEMGHVIKGHAIERLMNDAMLSGAMRAASRLTPAAGVAANWMRTTGGRMLQSAYSQGREFEADEMGVRLARAGGFDPRGAIRLLLRLRDEFRRTGAEDSPLWEYFASHPPFDRRVEAIDAVMRQRRMV